jgi:hypothetical protein
MVDTTATHGYNCVDREKFASTIRSMANRKKPTNAATRQKPNRSGVSLNCNIDPSIRAVLDRHVDQARPRISITAVVEDALEQYFERLGLWPPRDA